MTGIRYAPMNEADSAYTITGKGDIPLVWGSATSARRQLSFQLFRRFAEALGEFCCLIVYDKRGTGLSTRGNPGTPLETRMKDIRAALGPPGVGTGRRGHRQPRHGVRRRWPPVLVDNHF